MVFIALTRKQQSPKKIFTRVLFFALTRKLKAHHPPTSLMPPLKREKKNKIL